MKRSCGRRLEKSKICGYPEYVGTENHEGPMPSNPSASDILTAQAQCICERESSAFFCTACGGFFYGRVAQKCTQHPNVIFLLDTPRCVHCQAGQYMIRPIQLDRETVQEINKADTKRLLSATTMMEQ